MLDSIAVKGRERAALSHKYIFGHTHTSSKQRSPKITSEVSEQLFTIERGESTCWPVFCQQFGLIPGGCDHQAWGSSIVVLAAKYD